MAKRHHAKINKPCVKCGTVMQQVSKRKNICKKCIRVNDYERHKFKYHNDPKYKKAFLHQTVVNRAVKTIVNRELLFEEYFEFLKTEV
jgi:predicted  nucleic acid-binding Zn-ribbon protein